MLILNGKTTYLRNRYLFNKINDFSPFSFTCRYFRRKVSWREKWKRREEKCSSLNVLCVVKKNGSEDTSFMRKFFALYFSFNISINSQKYFKIGKKKDPSTNNKIKQKSFT